MIYTQNYLPNPVRTYACSSWHWVPPHTQTETAVKVADAVGVKIAGVDLISVADEPYVTEVNASSGFRGVLAARGTSAASKMVEYALAKAKHQTPRVS